MNRPVLTERECEILRHLSQGFTYSQTARLLGISGHTVASHIKNAYRKLEVSSAAAAVYRAASLGLLPQGPT